MLKLEWLTKNNIKTIRDIAKKEFKSDMKMISNIDIYEEVLNGNKCNNIDLNYALIKESNKNVGIIGYYIPEQDPKALWLGWFTIKDKYRHKGFGVKALNLLIEQVKSLYPDLEVCRTYTDLDRKIAINFYKKFGFIQETETYKLVDDEKDTVILNFPLNENKQYKEWNQIPIW